MDDFKNLLKAADELGIKIMLDMVFNHTSSEHPWFKAALAGDPKYRDYYIFANENTQTTLRGSWGQNIWHTAGDQYYCGYFSYTMPDLNFYNPEVIEEIKNISRFWVDLGVDGFRLDAAQHFFGYNEYQDQRYDFFSNIYFEKDLKKMIKEIDPDFYLIGEINENDETLVKNYFLGLDSPLDFPISARLKTATASSGNSTYATYLAKIYNDYREQSSYFVSAPFLTNHDQDRVSELLQHNVAKMKFAAEMLLTLPGTPILYYGEELGMAGYKSNGEKSGGVEIWDETRRLPLPFGDEYTTTWFSDTNFPSVVANNALPTASVQMQDPDSLYSTYKKLIALRKNNIALQYGNSFTPYENNTWQLQGFYREFTFEEVTQKVLILHNLSNKDLTLPDYQGRIIYASGTDDYAAVTAVKAKSTVIIDVTGDAK
jgi:glycosidase